MKLLTLLKDLPSHTLTGSPQVKISHLECDSRRILPGSCYIALKGTRADGHEFIPEAIRRGACAVVAEMPCTQEAREAGVSWVEVNDSRLAVSLMGAAWNGRPSRHMTMIGVTGTNGKTTTAYIAHSLLKQSWLRAGLIGTIAYDNGEEITPSTHTTPGPLELEHLLKEMYENGCRGVSMEVSSHALDQERVAGINFNVGIFTNLTQDHLDYTDATVPDSLKRRVWIHSRVHTSEAPAAWYLEAMIDELLSDAPLSREILRRTVFYVVPETNPDGVRGGYSRSTAQGVNLEINWDRPDSLTQPEVRVLKRTIDSLSTERPFDVALNLHSQSAPFVTYWIHTAKSTSAKMYRRKMLLSALTVAHTPYYRPIDQRFSEAAPRYAEGWFWQRFGERTLAVTFETPYTYYNNDPAGEWVSRESLAELAHASLLALSDLLDLGGSERRQADSERMKARGKWLRRTAKDRQFFGGSYLVAERKGASVSFVFPDVAEGRYEVFKWIPGPLDKKFAREENRWQPIGEVVQEQAGRLVWRYQAAAPGDVLDVILLVPKSER